MFASRSNVFFYLLSSPNMARHVYTSITKPTAKNNEDNKLRINHCQLMIPYRIRITDFKAAKLGFSSVSFNVKNELITHWNKSQHVNHLLQFLVGSSRKINSMSRLLL